MKAVITKRDHKIVRDKYVVTVEVNGEEVDYRISDKSYAFLLGDVVKEYREAGYEVETIRK